MTLLFLDGATKTNRENLCFDDIVLEYWLILTSNIKIKQEMNDEEFDEENVITSLNLHIFLTTT